MRKATVGVGRKEVEKQPKVAPHSDAKLKAMCDQAIALHEDFKAADDRTGQEISDVLYPLLGEIIKTKAQTQDGLRKKAETMFSHEFGYQWPSKLKDRELSDECVAALLRDLGVTQPIFQ